MIVLLFWRNPNTSENIFLFSTISRCFSHFSPNVIFSLSVETLDCLFFLQICSPPRFKRGFFCSSTLWRTAGNDAVDSLQGYNADISHNVSKRLAEPPFLSLWEQRAPKKTPAARCCLWIAVGVWIRHSWRRHRPVAAGRIKGREQRPRWENLLIEPQMIEAAVRSEQHMVSPGTRSGAPMAQPVRAGLLGTPSSLLFLLFSGVRDRVKWRAGGDPLCAPRSRLKTLFLLNGLELWLNLLPVCCNTRSLTERRSITQSHIPAQCITSAAQRTLPSYLCERSLLPVMACNDKHLLKYCTWPECFCCLLLHTFYSTTFI